ncbi:MAG: tetratricopeptide repeat protein [Bacteroidales bacterium]|nr:tetratricopeptide repeat protein [Bacteroidales bacterium]
MQKKEAKKRRNKNQSNKIQSANKLFFPFSTSGGWKPGVTMVAVFAILSILIYSNSFDSPFQFDDTLQILAKDRVNDLSQFASLSEWVKVSKRPVSFFSFALNFYFSEYEVYSYHLINLIIHILAGIAVFLLVLQLFRTPVMKTSTLLDYRYPMAFFTALIFLTHPIQTQAVTYIVQRMTSLSALFYFLAVFFYAEARMAKFHEKKLTNIALWLGLTGLASAISLLTKQIAATLPFIFLLYEICFIRTKQGKYYRNFIIAVASVLSLFIIVVAVFGLLPAETRDISRMDYLITQFRVIVKYLQLFILPVNQNLDYDFALSTSFFSWDVLLSFLLLIALLVVAIIVFKKHKPVSFGIGWFFIALAVESSVIPIRDVIFEHRLYLPLFGLSLVVVYLVFNYIPKRMFAMSTAVLTFLIVIYSFATYARNESWRTQYSIWKDVAEKSPGKFRPWYNLGKIALDDGKYSEAVSYLKNSLRLDPDAANAWYNLGLGFEKIGQAEEAKNAYLRSVELDSTFVKGLNNLGNFYISEKQYDKALELLEKAYQVNSKHIPVLQNLGIAYYYNGEYDKAIQINLEQLEINPRDAIMYTSIGKSYMFKKEYTKAISAIQKGIELNPDLPNVYVDLGSCYYNLGQYQKSIESYEKALERNPNNHFVKKYLSQAKKMTRTQMRNASHQTQPANQPMRN